MSDSTLQASPSPKPFVIRVEQQDAKPNGHFRPAASLILSPALRTSGLLQTLPPEAAAWLLFLLTFTSPNGECRAHLQQISEAMHVSSTKAARRMRPLCEFVWTGQPLVIEIEHGAGNVSYTLSPHVIAFEQHTPPELKVSESPAVGGFRDAIIEHSRATYARPRAEVERMIAEQLGHPEPQTEEERVLQQLQRRLENAGLTSEQARSLLQTFEKARIERQLAWLPYRNAKNQAAFLMAAIDEDYAEPLALEYLGTDSEQNEVDVTEPGYE